MRLEVCTATTTTLFSVLFSGQPG